jgi:hypothetical protein
MPPGDRGLRWLSSRQSRGGLYARLTFQANSWAECHANLGGCALGSRNFRTSKTGRLMTCWGDRRFRSRTAPSISNK